MRKLIILTMSVVILFCMMGCGSNTFIDNSVTESNVKDSILNEKDNYITDVFDLYDGKIAVDTSYDGIAGGFYLCDAKEQLISNTQIIETPSDMEYYIKCANPGISEICYSVAVIIDDCYQDMTVISSSRGELDYACGSLQSGEAETLCIKMRLQRYEDYEVKDENIIKFIMTYYMPIQVEDELELVPIAVSEENHIIRFTDDNAVEVAHNVVDTTISEPNPSGYGYWIVDEIPEEEFRFDFILDASDLTKKICVKQYKGVWFGILYVDGKPQKIGNGYMFELTSDADAVNAIDANIDEGKFIYMCLYKKGNDEIITVTPLYSNR